MLESSLLVGLPLASPAHLAPRTAGLLLALGVGAEPRPPVPHSSSQQGPALPAGTGQASGAFPWWLVHNACSKRVSK